MKTLKTIFNNITLFSYFILLQGLAFMFIHIVFPEVKFTSELIWLLHIITGVFMIELFNKTYKYLIL